MGGLKTLGGGIFVFLVMLNLTECKDTVTETDVLKQMSLCFWLRAELLPINITDVQGRLCLQSYSTGTKWKLRWHPLLMKSLLLELEHHHVGFGTPVINQLEYKALTQNVFNREQTH